MLGTEDMKTFNMLLYRCGFGRLDEMKKILSEHKNIDIHLDEDILFRWAAFNSYIHILEYLVDNYSIDIKPLYKYIFSKEYFREYDSDYSDLNESAPSVDYFNPCGTPTGLEFLDDPDFELENFIAGKSKMEVFKYLYHLSGFDREILEIPDMREEGYSDMLLEYETECISEFRANHKKSARK